MLSGNINLLNAARSEVSAAMMLRILFLWDVMLCSRLMLTYPNIPSKNSRSYQPLKMKVLHSLKTLKYLKLPSAQHNILAVQNPYLMLFSHNEIAFHIFFTYIK
jgi:hypothetical protein